MSPAIKHAEMTLEEFCADYERELSSYFFEWPMDRVFNTRECFAWLQRLADRRAVRIIDADSVDFDALLSRLKRVNQL